VAKANEMLEAAAEKGRVVDFHVTSCGDDLEPS
jgi:fructose 1,6-bisphosphatase